VPWQLCGFTAIFKRKNLSGRCWRGGRRLPPVAVVDSKYPHTPLINNKLSLLAQALLDSSQTQHCEWQFSMAINFSSALGIHETALLLRERRAGVLANNIANADTPNFLARDLDFKTVLSNLTQAHMNGGELRTTCSAHIGSSEGSSDGDLLYRTPMQPSLDGNTVDSDMEMSNFARNALDFQASLTFLQSKLRGLKGALRGD
jgi:flagellar basal-body rod protein FlgB